MDWETAFEQCEPYGAGKGSYGQEDIRILTEMEHSIACHLHCVGGDGLDYLNQYLSCQRQYMRRCCRYFYYRGMLHGTREALYIWQEEYGDS